MQERRQQQQGRLGALAVYIVLDDHLDAELGRIRSWPFDIELQGAGCFNDGAEISAVWAGVAESAELRRL